MPEGIIKTVKVHYRQAKLSGGADEGQTLQQHLIAMLDSSLGKDAIQRVLPMADDDQHQGCLNFSDREKLFVLADIMHLDGRTSLPRWIHPKEPKPFAEIKPRDVEEGEASLGEPVYILVSGNHLAAIERMGFRTSNLSRYLNALLRKAGQLDEASEWRLLPKIEITGEHWHGGGVKRVVVKPHAAVSGYAASHTPPDQTKRRARSAAAALEDIIVHGQRVLDALKLFGADEAKLERLREAMSSDLIIKAKLELSVASVRRRTTAEISSDAVQQALAEMTQMGEVIIHSEDGRSNGKLVQLVHTAEVLEVGGLMEWARVKQAMSSAISAWAAKGAIELEG